MSRPIFNLASDPFVNMRPLSRLTIFMWVFGVLLMAANVWLYYQYYTGSADGRKTMAELSAEERSEQEWTSELNRQISTLDLEWQREQVLFLNNQIEARTFSWSRLLDRVVEVLPADVRLNRLDPNFAAERGSARIPGQAPRGRTEEIQLNLDGAAKSGADVLAFVDALYAHEHFVRPSLLSESLRDGVLSFRIETFYLGLEEESDEVSEQDAAPVPHGEDSPDLEPSEVAVGAVGEELVAGVADQGVDGGSAAEDASVVNRSENALRQALAADRATRSPKTDTESSAQRNAGRAAGAAPARAAAAAEAEAAPQGERFFADLSEEGADDEFRDLFGDLDEEDGRR